ncbi:NADPH:adrenodoxin oxidoreductase, putative [Pediculus humanus corporis]|uniref:NADPH:adrenodoxin oxidoreductase, mitochondrial n=1 Tax=Pediculus humanus subsp. corporis TaxID=121224 RepID=E0VUT6_PEDHC|nr:NADPH:adrenodoxin oxidoreductase, putative [Pediculus humanus corporis]EEB17142.1 NADPH:adrenodoxin oxidoreductase, putative [Pediculus humanus corporis]
MIKFNLFSPFFKWKNPIIRKYSCSNTSGIKICIVGSGPAGFYSAQQLIKISPNVVVDIYERLPVPFGLVRYGVAPDHADVKNVINTFTKTAKNSNVNFYGNICLGIDITLQDLINSYHVVLLTYGAEEDRKLNIEGEKLKNVISARRFVGWYNGLPNDRNLNVDLNGENAVIIGQGNVAIDVARILLSPIDKLKHTDITEYALEALNGSKVKNVCLIGRRGPLQIACTIKELREMIKMPGVCTILDRNDFVEIEKIIPGLGRPRKRLTELMYNTSIKNDMNNEMNNEKKFQIIFKRTPLELLGNGKVEKIRTGVNVLEGENVETQTAKITNEIIEIPCDLCLRSIGYKSIQAEPNIPFDFKKGIIENKNGRILPGLYSSGWVSTGPVGVILSTMNNAFTTAQIIQKDIEEKLLDVENGKPGSENILSLVNKKGIQIVRFEDWEKIDREEEKRGKIKGKPREKIVTIEEMLKIAC